MEAFFPNAEVHIFPWRCLFLFQLYLIFNQRCLCGCVGVHINAVMQWKVVGGADVLNSCAQSILKTPG